MPMTDQRPRHCWPADGRGVPLGACYWANRVERDLAAHRSTICRPPAATRKQRVSCGKAVFLLHNLLHKKAENRPLPAPPN
jgi:hypothetical protein